MKLTFHPTHTRYYYYSGLIGLAVGRGSAGALNIQDFVAVPLTALGWVIQEWAIHRYLLHGWTNWPGHEIHQGHHDLPFFHISIDPPVIVLAWGFVACGLGWLLLPSPLSWTVLWVSTLSSLLALL